jgi:hypothetical protein
MLSLSSCAFRAEGNPLMTPPKRPDESHARVLRKILDQAAHKRCAGVEFAGKLLQNLSSGRILRFQLTCKPVLVQRELE